MTVPLLDLQAQYRSIKDEIKTVLEELLDSQHFILGPRVEALEKAVAEYCGCRHAVGVSSGTDALLVSLMASGIGAGHGVITSPFTFFATAGSIVRAGARPFFVDIDPVSFNIDPEGLREFLEKECSRDPGTAEPVHRQTNVAIRAVIPVHLYGQCADMAPILALAEEYDLVVIEDAAQAIGAAYPAGEDGGRRAGSMGDFGCLSFFPTKNLGGFGDGGMVLTNDGELSTKLKVLRVHGSKPKYYHHLVGGNFRLDALQAAVLLVKLKHLDEWTKGRRCNAAIYNDLFRQSALIDKGLIVTPKAVWDAMPAGRKEEETSGGAPLETGGPAPDSRGLPPGHIYNQYVIRARRRDDLRAYLTEQGIGTEIYYPLALHQQDCFADLGYREGDFPESEKAAAESLALPIYPELESRQLEYVVGRISDFYKDE